MVSIIGLAHVNLVFIASASKEGSGESTHISID